MPSFLSPEFIISAAGPWALIISALIVFAETGLLVGFFLPGDSLVFLLGMVSAATALPDSPLAHTPLALICVVIGIAAFVGDQTGYELGRKGRDSRLLQSWTQGKNAERLERAHSFFVKYGYKAIILARFVPILRTFTPFAVGLTHYDHKKFISANLIGTLIWGLALPTLGHQLGRVSLIANNIDAVCIIIVLISVMPLVVKGIRSAIASRGATQA